MTCPVCSGSFLPEDVSIIEKQGKRVILQGKINSIVGPQEAHSPPFARYFMACLYPLKWRKGDKVNYMKFKNQKELSICGFKAGDRIRCEGCIHVGDGRRVVFDVTEVESL